MSKEQKRAKILAAAATHGSHGDLYWDVARELESEGLIVMRVKYTATGNPVNRWFLA